MNSSGWMAFAVVFLAVLLMLGGGYVIWQVYTPPASATAPVTPEVRQFRIYLHTLESGDETVRHWMPSVIAVRAGDSVILRVANTDPENSHGFSLGAFNVSVPAIPPGETVTLRFAAARPGIFHFGCTLAGCAVDHMDQTGQLIVLGDR